MRNSNLDCSLYFRVSESKKILNLENHGFQIEQQSKNERFHLTKFKHDINVAGNAIFKAYTKNFD